MTAAYNEFMRQYQATGSEKADGYSRDAFIGLDPQEKQEVFKLLQTELPYSVDWLFYLDAEQALPVVKEKEEAWRGDRAKRVFLLQQALVKYTRDLVYQDHMIEDYPNYIDYLRQHALDSISRTPANAAIVELFKQVIFTEADDELVFSAADGLLTALEVPCSTEREIQQYQRMIDQLCSHDVQEKLRAFGRLVKYKEDLWR